MQSQPLHDRARRVLRSPWLAVIVACTPFVALGVVELAAAGDAATSYADWAVLEVGTRSAMGFDQLLGPYSRYLWNHPGPFLFYWAAPWYAATGGQLGGLLLAAAVLNTVFVAGIVIVAGKVAGRAGAWAACAVVLVAVHRYDLERFREIWNPTLTVLAMTLTLALAVAVGAGRRWALPLLVALASISVQIHIGTAPTVLAAGVVALALAIVPERHELRPWVRPALVSGGVLVVLWALPVVEQLTREPGNFGQLAHYARSRDTPLQPVGAVARASTVMLAAAKQDLGHLSGPSSPNFGTPSVTGIDMLVPLVCVGTCIAAGLFGWRRRQRLPLALGMVTCAAVVATVLSAFSVDGDLYLYLIAFAAGVGYFTQIGALAVAFTMLGRLSLSPGVRRGAGIVGGVVVAWAVLGGVQIARDVHGYAPSTEVDELATAALDALPPADDGAVRVRIAEHGRWPTAAGIVAELEDQGYDVTVDGLSYPNERGIFESSWTFMFGEDHAPTGREEEMLVLASDWLPAVFPDDGEELGRSGETVLFLVPDIG